MSSEDQDLKFSELLHGSYLEKDFPNMNSPYFAQKIIGKIKKQSHLSWFSRLFCREVHLLAFVFGFGVISGLGRRKLVKIIVFFVIW